MEQRPPRRISPLREKSSNEVTGVAVARRRASGPRPAQRSTGSFPVRRPIFPSGFPTSRSAKHPRPVRGQRVWHTDRKRRMPPPRSQPKKTQGRLLSGACPRIVVRIKACATRTHPQTPAEPAARRLRAAGLPVDARRRRHPRVTAQRGAPVADPGSARTPQSASCHVRTQTGTSLPWYSRQRGCGLRSL